jgi:EmrB/QacA subfamily drug resistance transporter
MSSTVERHPRRWWILAVLCVSLFMVTLDNTVLNVAIPSLIRELGVSTSQVQWVVDAYSLVFAGLLLTAGGLSDRFGRRRGVLIGLVLFGLGSAAAAFAASGAELIVTRGLMGVGGAFLMPGTLSILVQVFEPDERPKAIGVWGGISGLGIASGPVVGGVLVEHFWWGSVFLVNAPIALLALVAVCVLVPESRNANAAKPDVVGAVLSTVGMVAAVWAVINAPGHGWTSSAVLMPAATAIVVLGSFAYWEARCAHPLLDLSLLRNRRFLGASSVGTLLMFALAGATFVITQFLQLVLGYSPLQAGLRTVPVAVAITVAAPLSPRVAQRLGNGPAIAIGMVLVAVGLGACGAAASSEAYWPVLVALICAGLGIGTAMAPASSVLMSSFPRERAGLASALNDTVQELGAALGVAVLGSILATGYKGGLLLDAPARSAFESAMGRGLLLGAGIALAAAAVALFALGSRKSPRLVENGLTHRQLFDAESTRCRREHVKAAPQA